MHPHQQQQHSFHLGSGRADPGRWDSAAKPHWGSGNGAGWEGRPGAGKEDELGGQHMAKVLSVWVVGLKRSSEAVSDATAQMPCPAIR